jgi:multiple sugar transport system permease protein
VKKPIAGGSGVAGMEAVLPHPGTSRPSGMTRFLENERLLAVLLLTPTVVLLGVFIAYPFVMGVWLSLSNVSVGNPGEFVASNHQAGTTIF